MSSVIQYSVNEEKRVVVAYMDNCQNDAIAEVGEDFVLDLAYDNFGCWGNKFEMKKTYNGKAVCAPEDTFDVEVGKKIAKNRLLFKYHASKIKQLKLIQETIVDELKKNTLEEKYFKTKRLIEYANQKATAALQEKL